MTPRTILDKFQKFIHLIKVLFLSFFMQNFHTISKFYKKFAQKRLIFSNKSNLKKIALLILLTTFSFGNESGTLIVSYRTNSIAERLDRIRFWLKNEGQDPKMYPKNGVAFEQENIQKKTVVIKDLKSGNYTLEFVIPNQDGLFETPEPKKIAIIEDQITEIDQIFMPKYASIKALAYSLSDCNFKKKSSLVLKNSQNKIIQKSVKGFLLANQLLPGDYTLCFEDLHGITTPLPLNISLAANQNAGPFVGFYEKAKNFIAEAPKLQTSYIKLLPVPGGETILGDPSDKDEQNQRAAKTVYISPFAIGLYEVTNQEYADFLTKMHQAQKITYKTGLIKDLNNQLLLKTKEGDIYSQIIFNAEKNVFAAEPGKEKHPVINVSWYGAYAFARDQNLRLPTEAEWEKAAGMALGKLGDPLKKFTYGFSKDTINPTFANYRTTDQALQYFQVLTKEVGFYNGKNEITLSDGTKSKTHNAKSPIGAYDMSGNIWEWVSDWYSPEYEANFPKKDPKGPASGTKKVVKGGCYDSLSEGVRVAERMGLSQEHTDPYTGFRVAK